MYNTSNPAELYNGTTWELLPTDRYLKTTTGTPLSTGGSNSFTISKANLPATKLQIESFSMTMPSHYHYIASETKGVYPWPTNSTYIVKHGICREDQNGANWYGLSATTIKPTLGKTSDAGANNTGTANPYTQNLGSGTAISINPTYITLKFWKRLT